MSVKEPRIRALFHPKPREGQNTSCTHGDYTSMVRAGIKKSTQCVKCTLLTRRTSLHRCLLAESLRACVALSHHGKQCESMQWPTEQKSWQLLTRLQRAVRLALLKHKDHASGRRMAVADPHAGWRVQHVKQALHKPHPPRLVSIAAELSAYRPNDADLQLP